MGGASGRAHGRLEQPPSMPLAELEPDDIPSAPEQLSVDRMARLLVPGRLASEDRRILLAYLGLDNGDTAGAWLPQQELPSALPSAATSSSRLCTGLANAGAGSRG